VCLGACPGAAELIRKYCQQCMFCMMANKSTAVPVPYVRPYSVFGFFLLLFVVI
jgi:hypothetical protein